MDLQALSCTGENDKRQIGTSPLHSPKFPFTQSSCTPSPCSKRRRTSSVTESVDSKREKRSKNARESFSAEHKQRKQLANAVIEINSSDRPHQQTKNRSSKVSVEALGQGHPLSESNLRLFNRNMGEEGSLRSIKRTSSHRSMFTTSETDSIQSPRSANTAAHYRYQHLDDANVYIHTDPPEYIQTAIDNIVNAKYFEDYHQTLLMKAKDFWMECTTMVRAAAGEDDFVHRFYTIAEEMKPSVLVFREKADWRTELKPVTLQSDANLSLLFEFDDARGDEQDHDILQPLSKRQFCTSGRSYTSPQSSTAIPPKSFPNNGKATSVIKTPRPDITAGIERSALTTALVSKLSPQDFNPLKVKQFLEKLQRTTIPGNHAGSQELAFIMVPTQRKSPLTFPTLVFEGKGYSTGRQIFEAENQAAVSGACGLKIQLMLDELVKPTTRNSDTSIPPVDNEPPLVFSICTQGPYHELWAHYTIIQDGVRQYNMVLLETCHGVMLKQVERFFIQLYNIMYWTTDVFLKTVVERLSEVARRATVQ